MGEISRTALFGKLNNLGYKALEGATVFCKLRGNPYVEVLHWMHQMLQNQDSDIHRIVRHFELNPSKLAADMQAALDRLPRGATSISDLSSHLEESVERAWTYYDGKTGGAAVGGGFGGGGTAAGFEPGGGGSGDGGRGANGRVIVYY